ncbi:MAG: DNA repair protein RadC [Alphaproteobacteria bacterium]
MTQAADQDKPHFHGHRERAKERLRSGDAEKLSDYDLMELVLFLAIPRRDVKPLAKQLVDRFGFGGTFAAADAELKRFGGVSDGVVAALRTMRAAAIRLGRHELKDRDVLNAWHKVVDYCRRAMADEPTEQFRLLFLDRKNRLIADEVQQRGTIDHTPVYPREVIKRALELGASALILVHNHPSGDPTPSQADIAMTRDIQKAAQAMGVAVHDHLIVGRDGHVSLRGEGHMT